MQRAMWFRVTVGGALVSLSACASPTSPNSVRVVGILDGGDPDAEVLESPDSARVGIPLVVRVTTYGSGSCTRADGADVTQFAAQADITPRDRELRDRACTRDLRPSTRNVTVRFTVAGRALIRVRGRRNDGTDAIVVRERFVTVR